jgi:hypothetical protein
MAGDEEAPVANDDGKRLEKGGLDKLLDRSKKSDYNCKQDEPSSRHTSRVV